MMSFVELGHTQHEPKAHGRLTTSPQEKPMRNIAIISLISLGACAPEANIRSGEIALCLTNNSSTTLNPSATATWDATGTVRSITELDGSSVPGLDCAEDAAYAFDIEESTGTVWTLAYGITDHTGTQMAPSLDLVEGDMVNFIFRQHQNQPDPARGFVVVDGSGLVAAVDNGLSGGALENSDIDGLKVHRGLAIGDNKEECGLRSGTQIEFRGSNTVAIEPFSSGTINIGSSNFEVFAISAYFWSKADCDENVDELSWAIFR